jgi:hypothetical protein
MDWAAWGPTIVSFITCIFFAGVVYSRQNSHSEKLKEHTDVLGDHKKEMDLIKQNAGNDRTRIAMIEAWRDGWNAARATYDHRGMPLQHGGD